MCVLVFLTHIGQGLELGLGEKEDDVRFLFKLHFEILTVCDILLLVD